MGELKKKNWMKVTQLRYLNNVVGYRVEANEVVFDMKLKLAVRVIPLISSNVKEIGYTDLNFTGSALKLNNNDDVKEVEDVVEALKLLGYDDTKISYMANTTDLDWLKRVTEASCVRCPEYNISHLEKSYPDMRSVWMLIVKSTLQKLDRVNCRVMFDMNTDRVVSAVVESRSMDLYRVLYLLDDGSRVGSFEDTKKKIDKYLEDIKKNGASPLRLSGNSEYRIMLSTVGTDGKGFCRVKTDVGLVEKGEVGYLPNMLDLWTDADVQIKNSHEMVSFVTKSIGKGISIMKVDKNEKVSNVENWIKENLNGLNCRVELSGEGSVNANIYVGTLHDVAEVVSKYLRATGRAYICGGVSELYDSLINLEGFKSYYTDSNTEFKKYSVDECWVTGMDNGILVVSIKGVRL